MIKKHIFPRLKKIKGDPLLKKIARLSEQLQIKAYLVGGAVRDIFMPAEDMNSIEWDFAVNKDAFVLGKVLADILKSPYIVLDKAKRTVRVLYKDDHCNYELDFTDFRGQTLRADLKMRDFTINTLCINVQQVVNEEINQDIIVDLFEAKKDIQAKYVRLTRKENFKDDPLRILRGFSFCAQFGLRFEKKTFSLIKNNVKNLVDVSGERISDELAKIFLTPRSYLHVVKLDSVGVLDVLFPEISKLRGMDQGLFHHLDAWQHSLQTLAQLEKLLRQLSKKIPKKYEHCVWKYLNQEITNKRPRIWLLKLACILHDIGKAQTRTQASDGRIHFYIHEKIGAEMASNIGRRLKLSNREVTVLKNCLFFHLRVGQLASRKPTSRTLFRFFRDVREDAVLILLLTIADRWAMRGKLSRDKRFTFSETEVFKMIIQFFKDQQRKPTQPLLLNGNEIMNCLHLSPGPLIGKILRVVEEAQAVKEIKNKQEAKRLAKKFYQTETLCL